MNYCIVKDGVIVNMIVCADDQTAEAFNALPDYEGAIIGEVYELPEPEPTQLDLIEAQVTYTAMMTDTLLEV